MNVNGSGGPGSLASPGGATTAVTGVGSPSDEPPPQSPGSGSNSGSGPEAVMSPSLGGHSQAHRGHGQEQVTTEALASGGGSNNANAGAQGKANKGMILRKSVEYIRYLQQLVEAQGARNRQLEAELRVLKDGEGDGAVTQGQGGGLVGMGMGAMGMGIGMGMGMGGYGGFFTLPSMPEGEGKGEDEDEEEEEDGEGEGGDGDGQGWMEGVEDARSRVRERERDCEKERRQRGRTRGRAGDLEPVSVTGSGKKAAVFPLKRLGKGPNGTVVKEEQVGAEGEMIVG